MTPRFPIPAIRTALILAGIAWVGAGFAGGAPVAAAQEPGSAGAAASAGTGMDAWASRLPPDLGAAARQWLQGSRKELAGYGSLSAGDLEREVVVALAGEEPAADFVLGRLGREPAETVEESLKVIAYEPFWARNPGTVAGLRGLAQQAQDPDLMLACLDAARRVEVEQLRVTLKARIASVRARLADDRSRADVAGARADGADLRTLAAADERWMLLERGAALPGFMRRPPPVFTVVPRDRESIRVVGIGDFGTGSAGQRGVAASIGRMAAAKPFDFGLTVGDNFYPSGMTGTDDPRWRDWWEQLYRPAGVTFYPSLGNHEWYSDDGAAAEIAYRSPTWRLPAEYYAYVAGPVEFFAVDTTEISEAQVLWLDRAIGASTARWKVVYGHHPIFAPDKTRKSMQSMAEMQARLWPVIRGRVDAYVCGHQHVMARMEAREGVHFFMSGGGGAPLGKVSTKVPGERFAQSEYGYLTLEADRASMTVTLYDGDGNAVDAERVLKGAPGGEAGAGAPVQ